MNRHRWAVIAFVLPLLLGAAAFAAENGAGKAGESKETGEDLFRNHCASCHAGGGNVILPSKPLRRKSLAANKIKTAEDIVKVMRNPGPGMPKYDEKALTDEEAKKIAEYVLETFK